MLQARRELVAQLADATWSNEGELRRLARTSAFDLDEGWTVLVATPLVVPTSHGSYSPLIAKLSERVQQALIGRPRALPTDHLPIVLNGCGDTLTPLFDELGAAAASSGAVVVVSDASAPWHAVADRYRRLVADIVPVRALCPTGGVVREADYVGYRLLYSLPLGERIEYVEHVLGPILRLPAVHKSTNLLGTLEAYFRCGGRRSTAANLLAIHENSLRYRLDRVQALLGRDLRSGPDRIHVEIALALTQIARQEMALDEEGGRSSRPEFRRSAVHVRRRRDGPGHHGAST